MFYSPLIVFYSSLHYWVSLVVSELLGNFVVLGWRPGEGSPFQASQQDWPKW